MTRTIGLLLVALLASVAPTRGTLPTKHDIHIEAARNAQLLGRFDEACGHYEAAQELVALSLDETLEFTAALVSAGRPADAIPLLSALPRDNTRVNDQLIGALISAGRPTEALQYMEPDTPNVRSIQELTRALDASPGHLGHMRALGLALSEQDRFLEALGYLRTVMMHVPSDEEVQRQMARSLVLSGRPGEALPELRLLLESHPSDRELRDLKAQALTKLGRDRNAVDLLAELLDEDPSNSELRIRLALARARAGIGGTEILDAIHRERPDHLEVARTLFQALIAEDRLEEAVHVGEGLVTGPGKHPGVLEPLALAQLNLGHLEKALPHLRRLHQTSPGNLKVLELLASTLRQLGHAEEAEAAYVGLRAPEAPIGSDIRRDWLLARWALGDTVGVAGAGLEDANARPLDHPLRTAVGLARAFSGDWDKSRPFLARAAEQGHQTARYMMEIADARELVLNYDAPRAVSILDDLLTRFPSQPVRIHLAWALREAGRVEESLTIAGKLADSDPQSGIAHLLVAECLGVMGHVDESNHALISALSLLEPTSSWSGRAHAELAMNHWRMGELALARSGLVDAARSHPSLAGAARHLSRLLAFHAESMGDSLLAANAALQLDSLATALPGDGWITARTLGIRARGGDTDNVYRSLSEFREQNQSAAVHAAAAEVHLGAGLRYRARVAVDSLLSLAPSHPDRLILLAWAASAGGDRRRGLEIIDLEQDPLTTPRQRRLMARGEGIRPPLPDHLGFYHATEGRESPLNEAGTVAAFLRESRGPGAALATTQLAEWNATHPRDWDALSALATSLLTHGAASRAVAHFEHLVHHQAHDPFNLVGLARARAWSGDSEGALAPYASAILGAPERIDWRLEEARLIQASGRLQEAVAAWTEIAVAAHDDLVLGYEAVGAVRRIRGDAPGALNAYKQLLELDPNHEFAQAAVDELALEIGLRQTQAVTYLSALRLHPGDRATHMGLADPQATQRPSAIPRYRYRHRSGREGAYNSSVHRLESRGSLALNIPVELEAGVSQVSYLGDSAPTINVTEWNLKGGYRAAPEHEGVGFQWDVVHTSAAPGRDARTDGGASIVLRREARIVGMFGIEQRPLTDNPSAVISNLGTRAIFTRLGATALGDRVRFDMGGHAGHISDENKTWAGDMTASIHWGAMHRRWRMAAGTRYESNLEPGPGYYSPGRYMEYWYGLGFAGESGTDWSLDAFGAIGTEQELHQEPEFQIPNSRHRVVHFDASCRKAAGGRYDLEAAIGITESARYREVSLSLGTRFLF